MERDYRLRGLSSDHHHALVLARRIRRQFSSSATRSALVGEVRREFDRELAPHFEIEEAILLPALSAAGEPGLAERTLRDHETMRKCLRAAEDGDHGQLMKFAEVLEAHVRFEERTLFPACETRLEDATLEIVMERRPPPRPRSGSKLRRDG